MVDQMRDSSEAVAASKAAQVEHNFTYHAPNMGQMVRYNALREGGRQLAHDILEHTPVSREQSLALTNLEQAIMWANAAIARNE